MQKNRKTFDAPQRKEVYYSVPFDSGLGRELEQYFDRVHKVELEARSFLLSIHERYRGPICDEHTEYVAAEDAEAGGVLAVIVPVDIQPSPYNVLWEMTKNPRSNEAFCFPRIMTESHFIPYNDAVKLSLYHSVEWKFKRDKSGRIRRIKTDEVWRHMPSTDRSMIERIHPIPKWVALGTRYVFDKKSANAQGVSVPPCTSGDFKMARQLYEEMMNLPVVPIGTLASILRARNHSDQPTREEVIAETHLSYHIDEDGHRYLFCTGLRLEHPDASIAFGVHDFFKEEEGKKPLSGNC